MEKTNDGQKEKKLCHQCGSDQHLRNRCPLLGRDKRDPTTRNTSTSNTNTTTSLSTTPSSSNENESPAEKYPWKYVHPTNENQTMIIDGKTWKFCKHCVCRHTKQKGFYNLSHTSSKHVDNFVRPSTTTSFDPSVNLLTSSDAPTVRASNTSSDDIEEFHDAVDSIPSSPVRQIYTAPPLSVSLTTDPSDELIFFGCLVICC